MSDSPAAENHFTRRENLPRAEHHRTGVQPLRKVALVARPAKVNAPDLAVAIVETLGADHQQQRRIRPSSTAPLLAKPGALVQRLALPLCFVRPPACVVEHLRNVLRDRQQRQQIVNDIRRLIGRRGAGERLPVTQHTFCGQYELAVELKGGGPVGASVAEPLRLPIVGLLGFHPRKGKQGLRSHAGAMTSQARPA